MLSVASFFCVLAVDINSQSDESWHHLALLSSAPLVFSEFDQLFPPKRPVRMLQLCQFLAQEPGTDAEIKAFATSKFGVTFPLFTKCDVNGSNAHPVYKHLCAALPGHEQSCASKWLLCRAPGEITWNFGTFFVVDRRGQPLRRVEWSEFAQDSFKAELQAML